jgi:2-hydroxyacyl-CoA lyase 1
MEGYTLVIQIRSEDRLREQEKSVRSEGVEGGLRSWALGFEVGYDKVAEACGGKGFLIRTSEEL